MFPAAVVIGTDLSSIQPGWVPPNCRFEIDGAEDDWTWDEESFDYIHNRNFVCAIRGWPKLVQRTYQYGIFLASPWKAFWNKLLTALVESGSSSLVIG
jgi:hypothetical protein